MTAEYLCQQDKMPPLCPMGKQAGTRRLVLEKLKTAELLYLSTLSPTGWPVTDCMHFACTEDEQLRPILYLFTHEHVRKLENIAKDPRVSVSICQAISFEERKKTWAFQFMGTASLVTDPMELKEAIRITRAKPGYEFAAQLPLEKQPCFRIDPIYGAFMAGENDPANCSIDYLSELE